MRKSGRKYDRIRSGTISNKKALNLYSVMWFETVKGMYIK